ncbi:MAG: protein translocase subunit SecD, partial [bacterium]|nr:protein translocase subunit SecD [bacterium]
LAGGTELVYKADVSKISSGEINDSMDTLRDVIERRVNIFGVSEPIVQVEKASLLAGQEEHRLIVELPGVTDIDKAIQLIGETPLLEFRLLKSDSEEILKNNPNAPAEEVFIPTALTGRLLERAQLDFEPSSGQAIVNLSFNSEGKDIFAKITSENVGRVLAIFLDGEVISSPVIREEIRDGKAQISGQFTPEEAKILVRNLNYGALPVPISLVGTETIGPSLGEAAFRAGIKAGLLGFALVVLFLVFWYRLPGIVASISLIMYVILSLAVFKLIPVTLTAAGLAGFILSIGMAVDANILIFERMREELVRGRKLAEAMKEGFHRAWLSIRDSNISSLITAVVLFWLGTSSVKGFALTLGLGVLISMFTAITISRTFLYSIAPKNEGKAARFLFSSGIHSGRPTAISATAASAANAASVTTAASAAGGAAYKIK